LAETAAFLADAAGDEGDEEELPELDQGPPPDHGDTVEALARALEAVCFALNRSLSLAEAASILERPQAAVAAAAEQLAADLRDRGLMLQRHHGELQLVTRPEVAWAVQRALSPEHPSRLSRAAMETVAIVAYRQPLTRAAIEAIRGVNCEAVLESLERRELVAEVGRQESPGHPRLFGTTMRFLQVVGLERIDDLPPLPAGTTLPSLAPAAWLDEPGLAADDGSAEDGTAEDRATDEGTTHHGLAQDGIAATGEIPPEDEHTGSHAEP
jgi:segregation and condensation protein B